ncbi:hypothetical protein ACTXT7_001162 [Hymenolepis weldensis]
MAGLSCEVITERKLDLLTSEALLASFAELHNFGSVKKKPQKINIVLEEREAHSKRTRREFRFVNKTKKALDVTGL